MPEIMYPYALDEQNRLVFIKDAGRVQSHCIECGYEMIARQGEINQWHFAHKSDNPSCSGESALHKTAKRILLEKFNDRIFPKLIWRCQICQHNHTWDIPALKIDSESTWQSIRPDISFWHDKKLVAVIEVVVSHELPKDNINLYIKNDIPVYIWRPTWITLQANRNYILITEIFNNVFHLPCRDNTLDGAICFYRNAPYPSWMSESHCIKCPFFDNWHCGTRGGKQARHRMELENASI